MDEPNNEFEDLGNVELDDPPKDEEQAPQQPDVMVEAKDPDAI